MQWRTLKTQSTLGIEDYLQQPRDKWTLCWPQQVVLAASSVYWSVEVEQTIREGGSGALKAYVEHKLNPQLQQIVELVRGKLTSVQMSTLGALVVIDVHARDTVVMMYEAKVEKVYDFNWQSQLRYVSVACFFFVHVWSFMFL